MSASNIPQNHLDLSAQNDVISYDINSLVDDDFEVIGSLSDVLHSVSLENGAEVPLYDIEIGNRNGTIIENSIDATDSAGDKTPLANNSLNLVSNNVADRSDTDIPGQSVVKSSSSIVDNTSLPKNPSYEDPVSAVESIRADYQAAQQITQQENELLRKACEKKNQQIEMLRRTLDEEAVQKVQLNAELEEAHRALAECRIKVDEAVASRIERDDIIKMLQTTIQQLQNDGDLSCLPPSVINEQALVSSLHEKEQIIEALKKQLERAEERYEKEHKEVLDLEEIVKILHEYIQNEQQAQVDSQSAAEHQSSSNGSTITRLLTRDQCF